MKILVSGASGLIGQALIPFLTAGGHTVTRMVRSPSKLKGGDVLWRPGEGRIDTEKLEGFDAVIHLAGESVAQIWTPEAKRRILESRSHATELLCRALAKLKNPPKVMLCASAVGYFGSRPGEVLTEASSPGLGFLANVVRSWEQATLPATIAGIRVVNLRFGLVLSPRGGAFKSMLLPFKLGLGGKFGNGRQHFPWVSIDDVVGATYFALMNDKLSGPINVTAPNPVTNKVFTKTMGRVLMRPTLFCVPGPLFLALPGGMGTEMFLSDQNVLPARLTEAGYVFKHTQLADAVRHVLRSRGKVEFTGQPVIPVPAAMIAATVPTAAASATA
ncbi:MAG: TIGR01777 family protein [Planctomycetes bacterium]|nr:TIGR01777 family protein [Planctomycetota bacterium]